MPPTRRPTLRADEIADAAGYERQTGRKAFRAGRCGCGPTAGVGRPGPRVPEPRGAPFESAVLERHRRRGSGVEEALTDMCPAGVSTRRVDGTGRLLWGGRMPSQTPSDRLEHVCTEIDGWGKRPLGGEWPCVFVDGVWRRRSRRTRVAGGFPDGSGALMPVCAGIRCVTANGWSTRRYPDMPRLGDSLMEAN